MVLSYSPDRALVCGQVLGLSAFTVPLLPEPLLQVLINPMTTKQPEAVACQVEVIEVCRETSGKAEIAEIAPILTYFGRPV